MGLAPTASTAVLLAVGDALAMTVLANRPFDREEYALFHPGGKLGRGLMKVREIMRQAEANPVVREDQPLAAAVAVMTETPGRPGAASVVDAAGKLVGHLHRRRSAPARRARRDGLRAAGLDGDGTQPAHRPARRARRATRARVLRQARHRPGAGGGRRGPPGRAPRRAGPPRGEDHLASTANGPRPGARPEGQPPVRRASAAERRAREELVEIGRRLHARDLVGAAEGNLSVRLGDGSVPRHRVGRLEGTPLARRPRRGGRPGRAALRPRTALHRDPDAPRRLRGPPRRGRGGARAPDHGGRAHRGGPPSALRPRARGGRDARPARGRAVRDARHRRGPRLARAAPRGPTT